MSIFQAIFLGIIQGLTELLPISSSAHLTLIPWIFNWTNSENFNIAFEAFDVALHAGTLFAIIIFFFKDWLSLIKGGFNQVVKKEKSVSAKSGYAFFAEEYIFLKNSCKMNQNLVR